MNGRALPDWNSWLFAGTHGHVVAIDQMTGKEVWRTSLPSTGFSVAAILVENGRLLCASGGRVFALDPANGAILWENGMKGLGSGLVYLTTANSNSTEAMFTLLAQAKANQDAAAAASAAGASG